MNRKRYLLSVLAVFVALVATYQLLHGVVLTELYEITKETWRSSSSKEFLLPLSFFSHFVISVGFVFLFVRGFRKKSWAEGVRYGLVFGMVIATAGSIEKFVMLDVPARLALGWFMGTLFQYMILGVITALVYKPAAD
jgi:hypothetical protein